MQWLYTDACNASIADVYWIEPGLPIFLFNYNDRNLHGALVLSLPDYKRAHGCSVTWLCLANW